MRVIFPKTVEAYAAAREELLGRISAGLAEDQRFTAAWLAGSYGRGEQDQVSDIDLFVIVDDRKDRSLVDELCARPVVSSAGSIPARLAVFGQFGEPVNIHENPQNAPGEGSFSAVFYHTPPVLVDWTFVPHSQARRPVESRLLFERDKIIYDDNDSFVVEEKAARLSERTAFFWMMAAVSAKYIVRGQHRAVHGLFGMVEQTLDEIELLLGQEGDRPGEVLYTTQAEQKSYLMALCERVEALGVPSEPRPQVDAILNLEGPLQNRHTP